MTDQSGSASPAAPIVVKATSAPIITSESFKLLVIAGGAVAAERLLQSDISRAAVLPVFGLVAVWTWGLLHRLRTWRCMKFLARQVPDDVATVGPQP